MSRKHATLSPSGAKFWINCPAQPRTVKNLPDEPNEAASQGTVAHHILEECITTGQTAQAFLGKKLATYDDDNTVLFEHEVDDEMVYGIGTATYYVGQLRGTGAAIHTEVRVSLPGVDAEVFGTSDLVGIDATTITVMDFKYGRSPVEPEGNYQAFLYAIMALRTLVANPEAIQWLRIAIIQPRDPNPGPRVKEIVMPISDLLAFEAALAGAIAATKVDNPKLNAGAHCRWCPAWGMCSASTDVTNMIAAMCALDIRTASMHQLTVIYEYHKVLTDYIDRSKSELKARLIDGGNHPKVKLVTGIKHKQWVGSNEMLVAETVKTVGQKGLRLLSPAAMAQLGEAGKVISDKYASAPPGDAKLVMATAKGAPYIKQTAESMFASIPNAAPPIGAVTIPPPPPSAANIPPPPGAPK